MNPKDVKVGPLSRTLPEVAVDARTSPKRFSEAEQLAMAKALRRSRKLPPVKVEIEVEDNDGEG